MKISVGDLLYSRGGDDPQFGIVYAVGDPSKTIANVRYRVHWFSSGLNQNLYEEDIYWWKQEYLNLCRRHKIY